MPDAIHSVGSLCWYSGRGLITGHRIFRLTLVDRAGSVFAPKEYSFIHLVLWGQHLWCNTLFSFLLNSSQSPGALLTLTVLPWSCTGCFRLHTPRVRCLSACPSPSEGCSARAAPLLNTTPKVVCIRAQCRLRCVGTSCVHRGLPCRPICEVPRPSPCPSRPGLLAPPSLP